MDLSRLVLDAHHDRDARMEVIRHALRRNDRALSLKMLRIEIDSLTTPIEIPSNFGVIEMCDVELGWGYPMWRALGADCVEHVVGSLSFFGNMWSRESLSNAPAIVRKYYAYADTDPDRLRRASFYVWRLNMDVDEPISHVVSALCELFKMDGLISDPRDTFTKLALAVVDADAEVAWQQERLVSYLLEEIALP